MVCVRELSIPTDGSSVDPSEGSIFFIGTATVLLRYAGLTILTDPTFLHAGDHVHLGYGLTSEKLEDPAIDIDDLPNVDLCVLSHYHGDHFDRVAEEKLRRDLPIVTTGHAARRLEKRGFSEATGLDTWQSVRIGKGQAGVRITALPARHGPPVVHRLLPPVMGSMLEFELAGGRTALRIYITGDTLVHETLAEIPRRYPEIDLALFHLGGTRILGVLLTMNGEQGVRALRMVNPRRVIPIHYDDFDVFKSPLSEFRQAVERAGLEDRVTYLLRGETYSFDVPEERLAPSPELRLRAPL
jgi:L-ascorbate metabolism protein UlaG (beta-lactamase superfamily)